MYVLTTMYDDGFTKVETCNDITTVFATAAIYLQETENARVFFVQTSKQKSLLLTSRGDNAAFAVLDVKHLIISIDIIK